MGYTKSHKSELTEVLPTNVIKGKEKQKEEETFKEKATRNWLDLPSDLMINILQRISVIGILYRVEKVCTNWRQICKDPCMWRVIYLDDNGYDERRPNCSLHVSQSDMRLREICKNVVDRSQGQLVDITMIGFCDDELFQYVSERSSQLRRLEIGAGRLSSSIHQLPKALKFPLLEEVSLGMIIGEEDIQTLGRDCPMLKTLKISNQYRYIDDELGLAIAENLPGLRHLQLKHCKLTDTGLRAILDRCCHLQVLDLNKCYDIHLTGELEKRFLEQIKYVKFTHCRRYL